MHALIRFWTMLYVLTFLQFAPCHMQAQLDEKPLITATGFADIYHVYDFNTPGSFRQPFLYNHNRHLETNLNLGLLKFGLENPKYRANLALAAGTYMDDNYSQEVGSMRSIFEANIGVALNTKNSLWLDTGILPSHLGAESPISSDNLTLTRSLAAENSPYFMSGAKLTWMANERLEMAALVLNGWQQIRRPQGSDMPSFGTAINYSFNDDNRISWNTFVGNGAPEDWRKMRYFSNLYGQFKLGEKTVLLASFDIGFEEQFNNSAAHDVWYAPLLIVQYSVNDRWRVGVRAEHYSDDKEVNVSLPWFTGFQGFNVSGASLNLDYEPHPNVVCRLEGRWMSSPNATFIAYNRATTSNYIIAASLAIQFEAVVSGLRK